MKGRKSISSKYSKNGELSFEGIVGINNTLQATDTQLVSTTYYDEPTSAQFLDIVNQQTNSRVCRNVGKTNSGGTGPNTANSGRAYIYIETSGSSDGSRNLSRVFVKVLGTFDASCSRGIKISYFYMQYGTPTDLKMQWQYLPDGADEVTGWVNIKSIVGNTPQSWILDEFNLKEDYNITSGKIKIRWYWQMGSDGEYYRHDQAIDDLKIDQQYISRVPIVISNDINVTAEIATIGLSTLELNEPSDNTADFTVSRSTTATYIDSSGTRQTAIANTPRIDYSKGYASILTEPPITNLYEYSNGSAVQNCTIDTTSHTVSFEGTGSITFSGVYVGTLVGKGEGYWNRVSTTFTGSSTGVVTSTISGDVQNKQFEKRNFYTSYIPTNGSTVTRNLDVIKGAGNSTLINSTFGTLYAEFHTLGADTHNAGSSCTVSVSDGTSTNFLSIGHVHSATASSLLLRSVGTVNVVSHTTNFPEDVDGLIKMAVSYEQNKIVWSINGTIVSNDLVFDVHPVDTFNDLSFDRYWGDPFYGRMKEIRYYKSIMNTLDLSKLTKIHKKYDISTMINNGNSAPTGDSNAQAFIWHPSGLSYYIGEGTNNYIRQYSVSEQYNLGSTKTLIDSLDISTENGLITGIRFNKAGTKLFTCSYANRDVIEYSLSSAYKVSTSTITTTKTPSGLRLFAIDFNKDGSEITFHENGDRLRTYTLSTPFTLSTISGTHTREFIHTGEKFSGFNWNIDGSQVILGDEANENVVSYDVITPYYITTFANKKIYDIGGTISSGFVELTIAHGCKTKIWPMNGGSADSVLEYTINME